MKKFIYIVGILIIVVSVMYNFSASIDPETYREEIQEARDETDRFMRYSEDSPFPEGSFDSLRYFPPDLDFRIVAEFEAPENPPIIKLGTNDGLTEEYLTYGFARFSMNGIEQRLRILENVEEEKLFIPFGDDTSAEETDGAGRYLDIEHHGSRTIVLDFNRAYNPYCAYVDNFTCPLPPPENLLTVAIRAGEKSYH